MIKENILKVREIINKAAKQAGRKPEEIRLIAVTKNVPVLKIKEAIEEGITEIGENRVQEFLEKYPLLKEEKIKWHFVGYLQRNKVKYIVNSIDLIHSLDNLKLAEEIDKRAKKVGKVQELLVEVNISGEESKYGVKEEETISFLKSLAFYKNLKIMGLMAIAPFVEPEKTRPYFRKMRELFEKAKRIKGENFEIKYLSLGMSNDFEVAIEEGSNMIRLGRAIFGGV